MANMRMPFAGDLLTTGMGILPHRELEKAGFDLQQIVSQSILMPATCALMNLDGFETVENAYERLKAVSRHLQVKYLHQ